MEDVKDILDKVVTAARRAEAARIDAGACQTRRDFDAAREAESALYNVLEAAEQQLIHKYPPISPRTRVRTTAPNLKLRHQWTDEGWASKKWGVRGKVITHHDSHGLCYDVRHDDGSKGCYDPSEIEVIDE